ncbi:MAG: vWA domain-containing protein [Reichenbachiella sp.]|uniref:vWA domain-containing protein n=1 Tax=Reichenbachiella sp. TaxID=2184521 RepID=UPI0032647D1D
MKITNSTIIVIATMSLFQACDSNRNSQVQYVTSDVEESMYEEEEIFFDEEKGEAAQTRNFYFLFDGSGSMNEVCSGEKKIKGAQKAVLKFIEKVPNDVNLGLAIFGVENSKGVEEVVAIGPDNREVFNQAILDTQPGGGTPLGTATSLAFAKLLDQYKKQLGYGEFRLIIVTDGLASNPDVFEKALGLSFRYPFISIYGIGLCMDGGNILRRYALSYTDAHNYEELEGALQETIAELPDFDIIDFNPDDYIIEQ